MASKRALEDDRVQPNARKRRKPAPPPTTTPSFKKAHPVNTLKSTVRSLQRLLDHDARLPATVRAEKERALETARHELDRAQHAQRRSALIARYHKVRFFDRQKATKRLHKARKERDAYAGDNDAAAAAAAERAQLQRKVEDAEVDVNYALYCPLEWHYVSLFPTRTGRRKAGCAGEAAGDDAEPRASGDRGRQGDPEMWERVKRCMRDGTLDALRNGRLAEAGALERPDVEKGGGRQKLTERGTGFQARNTHAKMKAGGEDDADSDDGFFET